MTTYDMDILVHRLGTKPNRDGIMDAFHTVPDRELASIQRTLDLSEEFGLQLGSPYVTDGASLRCFWLLM